MKKYKWVLWSAVFTLLCAAVSFGSSASIALATTSTKSLPIDDHAQDDVMSLEQTKGTYEYVYRLYNKYSGEHHYTKSRSELKNLVTRGWKCEGIAWKGLTYSDKPVYRLYNPYNGDHHYTTSANEYDQRGNEGWRKEGVAWYSSGSGDQNVYRLFNPYIKGAGSHLYTTSRDEATRLSQAGWRDEGIGWQVAPFIPELDGNPTYIDASHGEVVRLCGVVTREERTTYQTQMGWAAAFYFLDLDNPITLTYVDNNQTVTRQISRVQLSHVVRYAASTEGDVNAHLDQLIDPDLQPYVGEDVWLSGSIVYLGNAHYAAPLLQYI